MKVFINEKHGEPSIFYEAEANLLNINHINVISIINSSHEFMMEHNNQNVEASALLMENAPFGDFFDLTLTNNIIRTNDDKLIRTYFG